MHITVLMYAGNVGTRAPATGDALLNQIEESKHDRRMDEEDAEQEYADETTH